MSDDWEIKTFWAETPIKLDESINDWLDEKRDAYPVFKVKDIKLSISESNEGGNTLCAMIIYYTDFNYDDVFKLNKKDVKNEKH